MSRDWALLAEIKQRSCQVCGARPVDPAHIRGRGAGGPDTDWNVLPLCRLHHTLQHNLGWRKFVTRFPALGWHLESKGWQWINKGDTQTLWHPELRRLHEDKFT